MNKDKMTTKDIEAVLTRQAAAILSVSADQVKADAPLHTLGVDSLGFVELLVFIEKEFKIKLMESGMTRDDFRTIHALAKCISQVKG
ncbi:MAG: phosphopantetheine-binding protein [Candidatus Omnitrophota bacterium]